ARPWRRIHVTMLLPLVGVGLVENDLVAAAGEIAQQPTIVSRRAVPPGREQARTVEGDLHAALSSAGARSRLTMRSSSSARCVQVWRAPILPMPFATSFRT